MSETRYDIVVLGAGAAGCMAAIRAAQLSQKVLLVERNQSLGRKILLTGNGRCNLTNQATPESYIKKFIRNGQFLRTAFFHFTSEQCLAFFHAKGLTFKHEADGKIFPSTEKTSSVTSILEQYLLQQHVHVVYKTFVTGVAFKDNVFLIKAQNGSCLQAKKLIIATGGASYPLTGSDGNGIRLAQGLGHAPMAFTPALVPLRVAEDWVKGLQGLSLQNIRLTWLRNNKKIISPLGDLLFTHFGLSGPLILNISASIVDDLTKQEKIPLKIDLVPSKTSHHIFDEIARTSNAHGHLQIASILSAFSPKRMSNLILSLSNIKPEKTLNQITKKERLILIEKLKAFSLTIRGSLSFDHAMASNGGISVHEIHPKTMESKKTPGLYFAGEIIDGRGPSGGYNLQQAFSTGYLAGESAAKSLKALT